MRHFLLATTATGLLALPALAQTSAPAAAAPAAVAPAATAEAVVDSDTIIVTGTRRVDRTVADSPVPIDVIGAEALRSSGFTETNRLLNQLVPSFNFPQPSITDGTDVIRPATLRGLSPDQTLVLVNGKRRHTTALLNINGSVGRGSAAVDINLIPSAAIERIEVLRDGAAAQYGSDAIAGVINFQLARKREGGSVSVTYGQYDTSIDGVRDVTGIARDGAGNPLLQANSTGSASFFQLTDNGKERHASDGRTVSVSGNIGLPLGAEGFVNITAEYRDRDATNRTAADPRRYYGLAGQPLDPRDVSLNRFTHRYGDAATQDVLVFVNAGAPIGDYEFYAFGSFGDRNGESAAFYRLPNETRTPAVIYPDGFLPLITTKLRDYAGTVGVRGDVGTVKVDLSAGYARNEFDFRIKNTANSSLGASSPRSLDSGGLRYDQFVANLDLSRDIETASFKSVTLAGGVEYRREGYQLRAGEPDSYRNGGALVGAINPIYAGTTAGAGGAAIGAQGFPGIQPIIAGQNVTRRRTRDNVSVYGELDVDIADWWTVQLAGRYERYSDFGDTVNGKAATSIDIVEGIKLRGALSTGFRAPSLQQQFFAAQATNNVNGVLLETVTLPVDSPVAIALGAQPLKPEKSVSYTAGIVLSPLASLSITVDYYNIQIDNRIVVTENLQAARLANGQPDPNSATGGAIATILNNAGFNSVNAARFFINGIDTQTKGFDAVATWRTDIGDSATLRLTAGFNYNETTINGRRTAPGPLAQVPGVVLFGRQESLRIERGQPKTKLNLSADFEREWLGVTARANRFGSVLGAGGDAFLDVPMTAKWITDLEVRVEPLTGLQFAVGANNLFDVYPDRVPAGRGTDPVTGAGRNYGATAFVTPFSSFSPFGFNGRFLYARASYRF